MIGLVAPLLVGIVLKNPIFGLAALPYLLRAKGRNLSLIAFYIYVLTVILAAPGGSIYEWPGMRNALLLSTSTFLLLDEVLGGINLERERIVITVGLLLTTLTDYTLSGALLLAVLYVGYRRFGKVVLYLPAWIVTSALFLYLLRDRIADPVAQSFVIIGLGIVLLLIAERNDVEFSEVSLREEGR